MKTTHTLRRALLRHIITPLAALAVLGHEAQSAIPLVNATATIEQLGEGPPNENAYVVSRAIDGDTTSNVFGWAVYPGQGSNQSAVFQTSSVVAGNDWSFQLFFSHFATGHKIQQFRISATEDANPTVSSGATWTPLTPASVIVNWGGGTPSHVINGDGSVRVSGIVEPAGAYLADYTVRATSVASMNVTGFRLEVFAYDDDGGGGPTLGFQAGGNNGNIALTEFTAAITTPTDPVTSVVIAKSDAAPGGPVGATITSFGIPSNRPGGLMAYLATMKVGAASVPAIFAGAPATMLVKKGAAAPGLAGLTLYSFNDPLLGDSGAVAFIAKLAGAGVVSGNDYAIFSNESGPLALVARAGDGAPDTGGGVFLSFASVALPDGASAPVFTAKLVGTTAVPGPGGVVSTNNLGLWAVDSNGALRLLSRTGGSVTVGGTPKTIKTLTVLGTVSGANDHAHAADADGEVIYRVTFSDGTQAILRTTIP